MDYSLAIDIHRNILRNFDKTEKSTKLKFVREIALMWYHGMLCVICLKGCNH